MQTFIQKLEKLLMPLANIVSSNKYLLAMRDSFSSLIPFIVGGSFFGIFNWVVFEPTGTILGDLGLNLGKVFTGLEGEAYLNSGFVEMCRKLQGLCGSVVTVTFGIFSLLLVLTFAYRLAKMWKNKDPFIAAVLALVCYLLITPATVTGESGDIIGAFSTAYFGSSAVLTAIITTTVVTWIYCKLVKSEKILIKMPESVPPAVSNSFAVLIPVIIVLFMVTLFQSILTWISQPALNDVLYAALQAPLMGFSQGLGFSLIYQFLIWIFWWFGIHGHNVTAVIQNLVYMPAQLANQAGETSYIFTNGFFEAGLGHVIALPIAIFIASKRDDWRAISKVGLPAMIFNVQEPLAFGIPIVLNPLLLIPYVLNPLLNTVIGMLFIKFGLMPVFRYVVPWTMPMFFGGMIGTGSIMGGIYQLVCIALNVVVFIPFVLAGNAQYKNEQEQLQAETNQ
ncbi:MAG: PTS sugar transporter subunit IIC [Breznakia sp.]